MTTIKYYNWDQVAVAINNLIKRVINKNIDNGLKEIYNDTMYIAMTQVLSQCYILDIPRTDVDVQIVLNGVNQMHKIGSISLTTVYN